MRVVQEFHTKFNHPVSDNPDIQSSDRELQRLRLALLEEELWELQEALRTDDPVATLDALADLQYVLSGAVLTFGFQKVFQDAFLEVHRSNMSKLGENGEPVYREDGKILKGPGYSEPDLLSILRDSLGVHP